MPATLALEPHVKHERVQLVDATNRPRGSAQRALMRRLNCWHRATYVFVLNRHDELCIQERTLSKEVFPGYFDLATGGVVTAGEATPVAARRELAEELGVAGVRLTPCFDFRFLDQNNRVFGSAFLTRYDGPLQLQPEEVERAFWAPVGEALQLGRTTPDSRLALGLMIEQGWLHHARYCDSQASG